MKKLLHKDKKDKEEKKKDKEEKKKEKKEKKDKSKKSKKDKHSASTSSIDEVPESPGATSQSTTVVTKTTIASDSDGATKTTIVKETVQEKSGERVSETKTEEKVTEDLNGKNVTKETTTTTITESEPDQPIQIKTVVKETNNETPQGEERVVVTETSSEVKSVPSTREDLTESDKPAIESKTVVEETKSETPQGEERVVVTKTSSEVKSVPSTREDFTESDKPAIESKTVVEETKRETPQGKERVVITKRSTEVKSVPSTREFLMENFPEQAGFETRRHIQQKVVQDSSQPTHVSERTVIREVSDGGETVKTVTKVVSDEGGKRETTTTTTLGGVNDREDAKDDSSPNEHRDEDKNGIIPEDVNRKTSLPEWLDDIPHESTPKGKAKIDDSIEIPSPPLQRKEPQEKVKPTGPKVIEEIHPVEESKDNILDLLDDLENAGKSKPKEDKPEPPEEIPFTYEPKKPDKKVYSGVPVTEKVDNVKSANKAETAGIDFASLEKKEEPKPTRTVQQTHVRKVITNNGDTVETVTKTTTDDEGRVKKTETKTISGRDQKPKESHDVNFNVKESDKPKTSPKTNKRNLHDGEAMKNAKNVIEDVGDDTDDEREILEEIIVVERKRKARIPKSFVPYEKERPKGVLPIDMLIERQSRPLKLPPVGRRVNETVEQQNQNRKSEIPDLNELDRLLTAMEEEGK
uniref:Glutamic acid-rich protein-like n=1 Tax=Actinia tenebrosa TaxID=6105 RepID=A0A6P8HPD5_ACTTE